MAEIIDLTNYRKEPIKSRPHDGMPFHIIMNGTNPCAIVIPSVVLMLAPDAVNVMVDNIKEGLEFALITSNDLTKMRLLYWDHETGRVHGYEFDLFPTEPFNALPGFGHMDVKFITFNGRYLGRVSSMSREEFVKQYHPETLDS